MHTYISKRQRRLYRIHWQLKRRGYRVLARQKCVCISKTEPPVEDKYTQKWLNELLANKYNIQFII